MKDWAQLIIDHLLGIGICHFCVAPGSRNTPLILAIAEQTQVPTIIHFDERGLGFYALGYAKAAQKPVCIITTSGTAVGNLLPPLMEAAHREVPIIFLTADRPFELHACGANQTTYQNQIFDPWTIDSLHIPSFDFCLAPQALSTRLMQTLDKVKLGPIHINCDFREPFDLNRDPNACATKPSHHVMRKEILSKDDLDSIQEILNNSKKGLILMGEDCPDLSPFLEIKNWPIIQDVLSHSKKLGNIDYAEWCDIPSPDIILHFGKGFVSRPLNQWLKKIKPKYYIHVSPCHKTYNPYHNITHFIHGSEIDFAQKIELPDLDDGWKISLKEKSELMQQNFSETLQEQETFSEPHIFTFLSRNLKHFFHIFLGNSTPVRSAHSFFSPEYHCYANRGLSGIDGNIATAIGMQKALSKPLVAILGDQTFLHDLNSLAFGSKEICWILINNYGGGIFSQLPIAKHASFREYFFAKHSYSFSSIADFFDLEYHCIQNQDQLNKSLFISGTIIEIQVPISHTSSFYKNFQKKIAYFEHV